MRDNSGLVNHGAAESDAEPMAAELWSGLVDACKHPPVPKKRASGKSNWKKWCGKKLQQKETQHKEASAASGADSSGQPGGEVDRSASEQIDGGIFADPDLEEKKEPHGTVKRPKKPVVEKPHETVKRTTKGMVEKSKVEKPRVTRLRLRKP